VTPDHDLVSTRAEQLCEHCGICCTGAVLSGGRLEPSELAFAERHRLRVVQTQKGPAFAHPCPLLVDNSCSVHEERPKTCRVFRCRLLRLLESGDLTEAQASERISELQRRISAIESALEPDTRNALWWAAGLLGDPETSEAQRAELSGMLEEVLPDLAELRRLTNEWIASPEDLAMWAKV
jgi:Fe-S-cluster containining protein